MAAVAQAVLAFVACKQLEGAAAASGGKLVRHKLVATEVGEERKGGGSTLCGARAFLKHHAELLLSGQDPNHQEAAAAAAALLSEEEGGCSALVPVRMCGLGLGYVVAPALKAVGLWQLAGLCLQAALWDLP